MDLLDRICFSLGELAIRWDITENDILNFAGNNELTVSICFQFPGDPTKTWYDVPADEIQGFLPNRQKCMIRWLIERQSGDDVVQNAGEFFDVTRDDLAVLSSEAQRFEAARLYLKKAPETEASIDADRVADEENQEDKNKRKKPNVVRREARKLDTHDMHEKWKKAYRELRKKYPDKPDIWYAAKIAKESDISQGRKAATIRRIMKY